jgi:hypothetical protein
MKKASFLLLISIFLALAVSTFWPAGSFEEQLIRIQAKSELGDEIKTIEDESIEIQSVLLDYSKDKELILKTQLAMMKYPDKTRKLLLQFGSDSDFKLILKAHGERVIPVVDHFLISDIMQSIKLRDSAGNLINDFKNWWNDQEGDIQTELGSEQQGWYAIQFIKNEGDDFLGQFVIDDQGKVKWIQIERITESLTAFFSGGVRGLETRYVTDQEITGNDLLWASVDVLAVAGTFKLLRAGRQVARTGKSIGLTRTTTLFGSRLMKTGLAGRIFKVSAVAATTFVVIKHPTLITSAFAEIGRLIGIPPMLAQVIGISLLAFVFLYPFSWLMKIIIRPVITVVKWLLMILMNIEKRFRGHVSTGDS